jgi:hypothetical protein
MRPLRGQRETEVAHDPWSCEQHDVAQHGTAHFLGDHGQIESHRTGHKFAAVCGCLRPLGGFCGVCQKPACLACFGFCGKCRKPLCPRHSTFVKDNNGVDLRLCQACSGEVSRRKFWRALISPFVRFEDEQ